MLSLPQAKRYDVRANFVCFFLVGWYLRKNEKQKNQKYLIMKRFLLYLSALFLSVSFATAQETYEISTSTGTLVGTESKKSAWTSTELAGLTLTSTCNGSAVNMMNVNSGLLQLYANYNGNVMTYTLNIPNEYTIKGYTIKYKKGSSRHNITITSESGNTQTPSNTSEQTFEVGGLSGVSTSFTLQGATSMQDFIKITGFTVVLQKEGEGGEEPGDDSAIMEQYDAIEKPTFGKTGNTTYINSAKVGDIVVEDIPEVLGDDIEKVGRQSGVTKAIEVAAGAKFDLNITYQLNWGDLAIYQIENGEATKEYGYYYGSWEPNGSTAKVAQNIADAGISITEVVDGACTATFPITINESHTPGDVIVVRAITGVKNDATNSAFEQNIVEGGYVDFLFVVTEEVAPKSYTLAVGETEWATLFLDFNAAIPTNVEAYTVTAVNDGYVTLTQVTGVLPAETGVIVNATKGNYEFNYSAENVADVAGNLLKGTVADKNIEGEAYVLGVVDGAVGLYKALTSGTSWKNNANKAYLPASVVPNKTVAFYGFDWDGTTGVEEVKTENGNVKTVYDLTGRRIEAITAPGIYIVNGKKVLVK